MFLVMTDQKSLNAVKKFFTKTLLRYDNVRKALRPEYLVLPIIIPLRNLISESKSSKGRLQTVSELGFNLKLSSKLTNHVKVAQQLGTVKNCSYTVSSTPIKWSRQLKEGLINLILVARIPKERLSLLQDIHYLKRVRGSSKDWYTIKDGNLSSKFVQTLWTDLQRSRRDYLLDYHQSVRSILRMHLPEIQLSSELRRNESISSCLGLGILNEK